MNEKKYLHFVNSRYKARQGLSLIELVIVLGIIAILTAVTIPTFDNIGNDKQFKSGVESFVSDLRLFRNKALSGSHPREGIDLVSWIITTCDSDNKTYSISYKHFIDPTTTPTVVYRPKLKLDDELSFQPYNAMTPCQLSVEFQKFSGFATVSEPFPYIKIVSDQNSQEATIYINNSGNITVDYN